MGGGDLISNSVLKSATYNIRKLTAEEITAASRVVCGSDACRGASDASELMKALGLIPDPESKSVEGGGGSGVAYSLKAKKWLYG